MPKCLVLSFLMASTLTLPCRADVVVTEFPREDKPPDKGVASSRAPSKPAATRAGNPSADAAAEYLRGLRESAQKKALNDKNSALAFVVRDEVKLDFISATERRERSELGYKRLTVPKGTYGVEGHGTPKQMYFKNGKVLTARELARWIRNDPRYEPGVTVYLLACETGKGRNSFAQELADVLQTEVFAPTEKLWIQRDRGYSVNPADSAKLAAGGSVVSAATDADLPGLMKPFHPIRSK